jgi:hypothetical protein
MNEYNCFKCDKIPKDCSSYLPFNHNVSGPCQWKSAADDILRAYQENLKAMPHEQAMPKNHILNGMLLQYLEKQP